MLTDQNKEELLNYFLVAVRWENLQMSSFCFNKYNANVSIDHDDHSLILAICTYLFLFFMVRIDVLSYFSLTILCVREYGLTVA